MGTHYDFQGRCGVNLNGVTLAVAENLTISPISVSMDLVIPDGAAYDAAFGQDGPWQMYVLMSDGSKIQTRFEKVGGVQDVFHDDAGRTFFRADHVRFELESPSMWRKYRIWSLQGITAESTKGRTGPAL